MKPAISATDATNGPLNVKGVASPMTISSTLGLLYDPLYSWLLFAIRSLIFPIAEGFNLVAHPLLALVTTNHFFSSFFAPLECPGPIIHVLRFIYCVEFAIVP